VKDSEKMIFL